MKNWIVCWVGDGGDSESYSVFYSKVVKAKTKSEALKKGMDNLGFTSRNAEHYNAQEITIIE